MRESMGEANMTVIAVVIIGIVAAVGAILIPKLLSITIYRSCCNQSGGIWKENYCVAKTPITCEERESMWLQYDSCVMDNGKKDANQRYRAVGCSD